LPFTAVGMANEKGTRAPSGDTSETDAGQVSDGASGVGGGGGGAVGEEQALHANKTRTTGSCRRRCATYRIQSRTASSTLPATGLPRPVASE